MYGLEVPGPWHLALNLGFGLVIGLLGLAYNRLVLLGLDAAQRLPPLPSRFRAIAVGAAMGLLSWFAPHLVGGGEDQLLQVLHDRLAESTLLAALAARFLLGPLCYAAGTPGGLFAPLLLVGGLAGHLYGGLVHGFVPAAAPTRRTSRSWAWQPSSRPRCALPSRARRSSSR